MDLAAITKEEIPSVLLDAQRDVGPAPHCYPYELGETIGLVPLLVVIAIIYAARIAGRPKVHKAYDDAEASTSPKTPP